MENQNQSFQRAFKAHGKKSGSKKQVRLWQVSTGILADYNTIWLKILQDNTFCIHGLVPGILEYIYNSEKYRIIKNLAWAIEKQPVKRGKHVVHFRCFFIKWNGTGGKTNSMKSLSACDSAYSKLV